MKKKKKKKKPYFLHLVHTMNTWLTTGARVDWREPRVGESELIGGLDMRLRTGQRYLGGEQVI